MGKVTLLVGPPGSGKSTLRNKIHQENIGQCFYVSQDEQGKDQHLSNFLTALSDAIPLIIVDRMNFNKEQRSRYLSVAKKAGYETEIIVLHESLETCLKRCNERQGHPTIQDSATASKAINFFFKSYERPTEDEADKITFKYPENLKPSAIICDLDGTLCNIEHRLHYINPMDGSKKNWKKFFENIPKDSVNYWCADLLEAMSKSTYIVYCSGRSNNQRELTKKWLLDKNLSHFTYPFGIQFPPLFMRPRDDFRQDYIIKEIILDFEILTRYSPIFMIDDRKQVVKMYRDRGFTVLQCDWGEF